MPPLGSLDGADYLVFVVYFAALIWLSAHFGKDQSDRDDYYLGGRNLPWWAVGLSTAATQTSAIGFMSIPAFVALKPGGGLKLLQGEFVLPWAMIFIMVTLIPFFRRLELVSVYTYLERRFDASVKYLISSVFLISRGVGTAVGLYMTAIVFSTVMGLPLWVTIVIIGGITLVYDTIGGIKAVVYSDVVQMAVLLVGACLIVGYIARDLGGLGPTRQTIGLLLAGRLQVLDLTHHGLGDGAEFSFWPQFIGGFFLLSSYYGCDQTQTQRELSAASLTETRKSLILNGFFRFPLSLLYAAIGLALGAFVNLNPDLAAHAFAMGKVDYLLPVFIMQHIPHGLKALIFVAVLAAAMSSLDSSLNSLSAATQTDFIEPLLGGRTLDQRAFLRLSKVTTVVWGMVITVLAMFVGDISDTVIEAIGMVGSMFYGPILAAFGCGVLLRVVTARGIFVGVLAGVAFNGALHLWAKQVFWMWWNCTGCVVTVAVALAVSLAGERRPLTEDQRRHIILETDWLADERPWLRTYGMLAVYSGVMIAVCWGIPSLF